MSKQRLIDANELHPTYNQGFYIGAGVYAGGSYTLDYEEIENAPTVDAIPVAFIEEQMRKYEELAYNSIPKIQQRYFDKVDALKSLIYYWRKKDGKDDENEL